MNWYKYVVTWYHEIDDKEITSYGITCGKSYAEAMEHIEKEFDDTLVSVNGIELISDNCPCYDLDEEQYNNLETY